VLDKLTHASFNPYVQDTFLIRPGDGEPLEAKLISVTELPAGQPNTDQSGGRTPFSIIFRTANSERVLRQAIYTLEHPDMGEFGIFLVPIGPDEHGMRYEAVFT
jgi:hypothetical protein